MHDNPALPELPAGAVDFHLHVARSRDIESPEGRHIMTASNSELSWPVDPDDDLVPPSVVESQLDGAGVRYGVVLPQDTAGIGIQIPTDYVLEFCQRSTRLFAFASINPWVQFDAPAALRRWAAAGARGLKLYPSYQFFLPNDPMLWPIYDTCCELRWPVMFHTGTSVFRGSRLHFALPIHIDDVAVAFPELRIVLAHAGRPAWTNEAAALARIHAEVYLDISGLPPHNLLRYLPDLARLTGKVVFGSDWPSTPALAGTVDGIRGLGLTPEQLTDIFRTTAARLLDLDLDPGA